jgi:hypothetical protein
MQTNRHRVRRDYAPLNIAVSIEVGGSPLAQVYNAEEAQYEPDRALTSTYLTPKVYVSATDGSIGKWVDTGDGSGYYTAVGVSTKLSNIEWHVLLGKQETVLNKDSMSMALNGGRISMMINSLVISSNVSSASPLSIYFTAVYTDSRLLINHTITSEPVVLTTTDKADDLYAASLDDSATIIYDPFADKLALLEYEYNNGYIPRVVYNTQRNELTQRCDTYKRTLTVMLYKGKTAVSPADYTIVVMRAEDVTAVKPSEAATVPDGTFSVTTGISRTIIEGYAITFDARPINRQTYVVVCMSTDKTEEYARTHFAVRRRYPRITIDTMNGTSIQEGDTERSDRLVVRANGQVVSYPERLFNFNWFADTKAAKAIKLTNKLADARDGKITYDIDETHLTDSEDDYLETYVEADYKPASEIAVTADGEEYTDGEETYIIND